MISNKGVKLLFLFSWLVFYVYVFCIHEMNSFVQNTAFHPWNAILF